MRLKDKRILVTGSSGFVGRHLVARLEANNAKVIPFDITDGKDVTEWKDFASIKKVDVVFHLAAITYVPLSQENPSLTYRINILGTVNALECCRLNHAKIVYASSYVYGDPQYLPVDEKHPINPTNPYARSKVAGELLCRAYNEDYGVPCVILRSFNIYGAGQGEEFLIPEIIKQLKAGRFVTLKDLTPKRDFMHLNDAVDAYVKAGEYDESDFEIFNIGSGKSYSVREVAGMLIRFSGENIELKSHSKKRKGEISETVADIKKAEKMLRWKPAITIDEGLKSTLKL